MSRAAGPGLVAGEKHRGGRKPAGLLLGAMVGSLVAGRFETALLCVAAAALGAAWAGAPWPSRRWLTLLASAAGIAWTLNLFLTPGRPIAWLALGPWHATLDGVRGGALVVLRLAGAGIAFHGLRSAWPGERAADELARVLMPLERLRVPVRRVRAMIGLSLRFAPLLAAEAARIARLQDLRAGRPPRGAREWLTRRRAATVPTLVHALERAEQVSLALEARHYRLRPPPAGSGWSVGWAGAGVAVAGLALFWRGSH